MTDTRRRVKLYALNAERQWDDKGTGHVTSTYVERLKGMSLLVRAESDGSLLLESKIQPDTAYQKQQETLIVWSEGDNFDLALSFQEKAGCDEIWEKICQVQGKDPSVDFTQDIVEESEDERCFDDMNDSVPPIELPPCELGRLEEISELVNSCLPSPIRREKLAIAIENEVYIKKLLNLFHMCEDLENTEGLHHLYEIFKNIFLLNKNALFELMFAEDTIFDVVGCLEFDPSVTAPKRHREYLKSIATFHQVVKISNPQLLQKIHQTYRIQYIQDVVLPTPSVFEENMLSTLSSFIFFNKQEIVSMIQEDEKFLTELFAQLTDDKSEEIRRKELVLFLKEFCTFAQALQPPGRESFFKTLNNLGILQALEITLQADDPITKAASIDILLFIVEFSPSLVREYMLQQLNSTEDDSLLMNVIIEQMTCDSDPEMGNAVQRFSFQLTNIIRMLLDPENMLTSVNKSEKTDFLNYFYKHCMHVLISPLLANTSGERPEKSDSCTVQLQSLILELLSFFVEHHTYHIKNYILHKDLLRRILVLMKSKHKYLVLYALRFMRKIVALKDEFYNRYIIKGNLFSPVVDALVANNGRYNLLDSAILEMFEFIKLDIKSLCSHVVENFGPTLDKITYVQTFKALRVRYDQQQDRQKDRPQAPLDNVGSILRQSRFRRDPRQMDEDEEMWFNDDEDDYEAATHAEAANGPVSQQMATSPSGDGSKLKSCFVSLKACPVQNATQNGPSLASGDGGADTNEKGSPKASKIEELHNEKEPINKKKGNGSAKTTSPAKKSLVDYDGDSDEDEEEKAKEAENISSSEEEDSGKRIEVEKEKAKSEESSQSIVTTTETETETKENDKDSGSSTTTTTNAQTEKRIEREDSDKEEEPEPAAKRQRTEV